MGARIVLTEWVVFGFGVAGGLFLAAAADVVIATLRKWFYGQPEISSYFSPKGGCVEAIVKELGLARREVLVQAYSFTCQEIATALIAAAKRGVRVSVLLDRSNEAESYSELGDLKQHGIDVMIDAQHAIAHNKVMVIDYRTVLTGSFNFTRQAEHENAENLVVLKDHHDLAQLYRDNFHKHRDHSHAPGTVPLPTPHPAVHGNTPFRKAA